MLRRHVSPAGRARRALRQAAFTTPGGRSAQLPRHISHAWRRRGRMRYVGLINPQRTDMAQRTDAIVLGAGIVGTSAALQLAKRGLSVTLIDRRGPGEETSYGNTGVIVGASVFPTAFPRSLKKLIQVALKRAPEANY